MKKILLFLVFVCLGDIAFSAPKPIPMSYDIAQFAQSIDSTLLEFYFAFPDSALQYKGSGAEYVGKLHLNIEFRNQIFGTKKFSWDVEHSSSEPVKNFTKLCLSQKNFVLHPAQYQTVLTMQDLNNPKKRDSIKFTVVVRTFSPTKFTFSDIQLCKDIGPVGSLPGWSTLFTKSGYTTVPLPNVEYFGTSPKLSMYMEVYNPLVEKLDSFEIRYQILDAAKREQVELRYMRPVEGKAQVEVMQIPIDMLSTGVYFLRVTGIEKGSKTSDSVLSLKKFFVTNPEAPPDFAANGLEDETFEKSEFATWSDKRADVEFHKLKFIASQSEMDSYSKLTTTSAKQKYLFKFWYERDPNPLTPVNERYEEFKKSVDFANKNYSCANYKEGWMSDRGRILLKYGFPTQIDRHYFDPEANPYEIWYFNNVQGGVMFCFVDHRGQENFRLVHSTAMNEFRDENWYARHANRTETDPDRNAGSAGGR